jgi:hypothetical protein
MEGDETKTMEFQNEGAFAQYLARELGERLPAGGGAALAHAIAGECVELSFPQVPPGTMGMVLPIKRWIIKNDDLKFLESLLDGLKGAAAAGFFLLAGATPAATLAAVIGLAAMVFKIGRQALRKGRTLLPYEYGIVTVLCGHRDGLMLSELVMGLDHFTRQKNNAEQVQDCLTRLKAINLADGTVVALVAEDAQGRWFAAGI